MSMQELFTNVLNNFICCKGPLKLPKYKANKKYTCFKSLLKIEQQKCRLVNKTIVVALSLSYFKCSFCSIVTENKKQH